MEPAQAGQNSKLLLLQGKDPGWEQPSKPQHLALLVGERRTLVQPRVVQDLHPVRNSSIRLLIPPVHDHDPSSRRPWRGNLLDVLHVSLILPLAPSPAGPPIEPHAVRSPQVRWGIRYRCRRTKAREAPQAETWPRGCYPECYPRFREGTNEKPAGSSAAAGIRVAPHASTSSGCANKGSSCPGSDGLQPFDEGAAIASNSLGCAAGVR